MPSLISPVFSGAIDTALNQLIGAGSNNSDNSIDPRAALVFTSRLRQKILTERVERLSTDFALFNRNVNDRSAFSRIVANASRKEISDITGQMQKGRNLPTIALEVNPKSIEFQQPKRYTRVDTLRGTDFHHFTNSKGQNNDLLTIKLQGNTGNISRLGRTKEDQDRSIQRLTVWHNLYQLTREPMLLSDGRSNVMTISYVSPLFPVQVNFDGFFTRVLDFSENAMKPNSRDYNMEFVVQSTTPDLDTIVNQVLDYVVQYATTQPSDEARLLTS